MPPKPKKLSAKDKRLELVKQVSVVSGRNTTPVIEILFEKENVNEFLISKKLGLTINQIRNVLYKLSDYGLVSFIRKKDKKKGWYTYFWTFDSEKAFVLLKKLIEKEIQQLENDLQSRKTKQFYKSPDADIEYNEEKALEYNFICPETGEVMELKDTSKEIKDLSSKITRLKNQIENIDYEISVIRKKNEKKSEKRRASEKKEKAKKTAEKRAKTKADKLAAGETTKKATKKTAKKKTTKKTTKKTAKKTTKKTAKKKTAKRSSEKKK